MPSAVFEAPSPPRDRAVLLVNLGTPKAPNASSLRRYLRQFLSDRRVVELPRAIWFPVLYGIILPLRAPRSAAAYREIWTERGSPLRVFSEDLAQALRERLQGSAEVMLAMRYGDPSVAQQLRALRARGLKDLVVLPLYPQYSGTTTASVFDAVAAELGTWRRWPKLTLIDSYHQESAWIDAIAEKIREHRRNTPEPAHLLFSFHGIPQDCVTQGDPYADQCRTSAEAIAARLGLDKADWSLSFQSRLGKTQWLEPYTDRSVRELAKRGVRHLDVVCPGFAVDCLETLEEIAIQNARFFREAGGQSLRYVPALNADVAHVEALSNIIERAFGA
jgi:ferrochelatase